MFLIAISVLLMSRKITTLQTLPETYPSYASGHEYVPIDYSFSYGVKDLHSGDIKHQWEKKDGDRVTGHYSMVEPDGSIRSVYYTAGAKSGFNAVIKRSGPSHQISTHKEEATSHSSIILKPSTRSTDLLNFVTDENHENIVDVNVEELEGGPYTEKFLESIGEESELKAYKEKVTKHKGKFVKDLKQPEKPVKLREKNKESVALYSRNFSMTSPTPNIELPIDLSLLSDENEKLVPIDVTYLTPVEIDLTNDTHPFPNKNKYVPQRVTKASPPHEFVSEETKEFYPNLVQPEYQTGFKPITAAPVIPQSLRLTQGRQPEIVGVNKRPMTTPGLRNFASKPNGRRVHAVKKIYRGGSSRFGPINPRREFIKRNGHIRVV